ncbi:MAG: DUF1987 domain-containing protein [Bacteroidota bacterium]|nr:DUF1987 domain-containing protein [Bacteroidota bacterium]MDP4228707.1 DUF1987 domain-containing protein [Bacteroidota bacterium]MDP4273185.1 DUF1987 domain-containing protein [Bacteroidota bacterium]
MDIKDFYLEGTKNTPEIQFRCNGNMLIKGRSIPEDPAKFYVVIEGWVKDYALNPQALTTIDIELEYFNSGSSKSLLLIFRDLSEVCNNGHKLVINWYYEEGDDDILERGEYYASLVNAKFNFIEVKQA